MHSPIITTANELDLDGLFAYISEVKESSERILKGLQINDTKLKVSEELKSFC